MGYEWVLLPGRVDVRWESERTSALAPLWAGTAGLLAGF